MVIFLKKSKQYLKSQVFNGRFSVRYPGEPVKRAPVVIFFLPAPELPLLHSHHRFGHIYLAANSTTRARPHISNYAGNKATSVCGYKYTVGLFYKRTRLVDICRHVSLNERKRFFWEYKL